MAVPTAAALTVPFSETLATAWLEDDHWIVLFVALDGFTVAVSLSSQCVSNYIGLAWSIFDTRIILLNHFDPTSLPEVEIWLSEDVLETLVVSEDVHFSSQ